jgi:polysaccharide export outer membrane protein
VPDLWRSILRGAGLGVALGSTAACSIIPSAGPTRQQIGEPAPAQQPVASPYFVVDLDEGVLAVLGRQSPTSFNGRFGDARPAGPQRLGVGDVVQVTIWEAAAGGLFSAPVFDRTGTGARSAVIPEQQVGQDGAITVPYAGRIRVDGRTPRAVEQLIVERLRGQAVQPQALVTITRNVANTATVLGEVTTGGRIPLSARGNRLLDVIAAAGGIRTPPHETSVRLARGGMTVSMPLQAIVQHPGENITVHPDDVITVVRQPLTFVAAGATGRNAVIPFEAPGISLLEAVGFAGGLSDWRSDPAGVYLMRQEPVALAQAIGAPPSVATAERPVRVIYRLDMRDPAAFFRGAEFQMRDRDVLYVASAPLTDIQKILQVFNLAVQPAVTGITLSNAVAR